METTPCPATTDPQVSFTTAHSVRGDAFGDTTFPIDALPRAMGEYVAATAAALPCPVDLVAGAALGAASAAIGNRRRLQVKSGWIESPQLWLVAICEPGSKKSPALQAATRPLRDAQKRYWEAYQTAQNPHAHPAPNPDDAPATVFRQTFTVDTTRPGVITLLQENPRGVALIADEFQGWTARFTRGDLGFWLSTWSGSEYLVHRGNSRRPSAYLPHPFVSVIGCLPSAMVESLRTPLLRDSGFVDRLLFCWAERLPTGWSEIEPPPGVVDTYGELFQRLLELPGMNAESGLEEPSVCLGWTPDGKASWIDFVTRLSADAASGRVPPHLGGAMAKLIGYGARLALIVHVARHVMGETTSVHVDAESMTSAARLVAYFQATAFQVLGEATGTARRRDDDEQAVRDWMRRHADEIAARAPPHFRWQEIRHDLHNRFRGRPDDLRAVLDALLNRAVLHPLTAPPSTRGRPPEPTYGVPPQTRS